MRCEDSQLMLFEFAENQLQETDRRSIEQHLQTCDECAALLQDIWELSLKSANWKDFNPPSAGRLRPYFQPVSFPWLQLAGAFSSVLILVLVIFRLEVTTTDQGMQISLAGERDLTTYYEEMDSRFRQFEAKNQAYLSASFDKLNSQQLASNQLLLSTVLEASRNERQDDIKALMAVWSADQQRQTQLTEDSLRFVLLNQARERRNIGNLSTIVSNLTNPQDSTL